MKILVIRADASSQIGAGHVMRCLALAKAWAERAEGGNLKPEEGMSTEGRKEREEARVLFVCAMLPEALEQRLKDEGFRVEKIKAAPGSKEDLDQTLQLAKRHLPSTFNLQPATTPQSPNHPTIQSTNCPWLVADGYPFDLAWQRGVRAAGFRLMVIDDYNHLPEYECDILFNQNLGAEQLDYRCNPDAVRLFGPRYALLRPEFRAWRNEEKPIPETARKILVTLGGADPDNVTAVVMDGLKDLDVEVKVVVGGMNPHLEELQLKCSRLRQASGGQAVFGVPPSPGLRRTSQCSDSSNPASSIQNPASRIPHPVSFTLLSSVEDMPSLMAWADVGILAAGSTCWEACRMGLPMLNVVLAENQRRIAAGLQEKGIGVSLGEGTVLCAETVTEHLDVLLRDPARRHSMADRGRRLVDALGTHRIREAMCGIAAIG